MAPELEIAEPENVEIPDSSGKINNEAAMAAWSRWKKSPSPNSMSLVLKSVQPAIDRSVRSVKGKNPTLIGGEAKRLAIMAVKSYDPQMGTALSSHVFNHLKPLSRGTTNIGSVIDKSRLDRERIARYLSAHHDLTEQNSREPNDTELMDHLGIDARELTKMRKAATGEVPEGSMDYEPSLTIDEDPRMSMWTDYVYHQAKPIDKKIFDWKTGRNGNPKLPNAEIVKRLGMSEVYINSRARKMAEDILNGVQSAHADQISPFESDIQRSHELQEEPDIE